MAVISVINGPDQVHHDKDRQILKSINDIDIIQEHGKLYFKINEIISQKLLSETASVIWIILAILLSILLVLIIILGTFIIRNRLGRMRGSAEASNYTLGSSSGCTDQLVMTSSPSATEHGAICDAPGDSEHFIYINTSRNTQKPNIFHNHRLSHIIRQNGKKKQADIVY